MHRAPVCRFRSHAKHNSIRIDSFSPTMHISVRLIVVLSQRGLGVPGAKALHYNRNVIYPLVIHF